jgi:hypothetical protein
MMTCAGLEFRNVNQKRWEEARGVSRELPDVEKWTEEETGVLYGESKWNGVRKLLGEETVREKTRVGEEYGTSIVNSWERMHTE